MPPKTAEHAQPPWRQRGGPWPTPGEGWAQVEKTALQAELKGVSAAKPETDPKEQKEKLDEATTLLKSMVLGNPDQTQLGEVLALLEDTSAVMEISEDKPLLAEEW